MNEKLRKVKIEINQIDEKVVKIKDIQQQTEVDFVQKVVEKLQQKEENIICIIIDKLNYLFLFKLFKKNSKKMKSKKKKCKQKE